MLAGALLLGVASVLFFAARAAYRIELDARLEIDGKHSATVVSLRALGLTLSLVGALRVAVVDVHFWGLRLLRKRVGSDAAAERALGATKRKALGSRQLGDALGVVARLANERRRVQSLALAVDASYSQKDVAVTGQLAGAPSVLASVLPPGVSLRHEPRWEAADRVSIELSGQARIRLALVAFDLLLGKLRAGRRSSVPIARAARRTT